MEEKMFYTYLWLRENGTPYYVGKGKSKRGFRKGCPVKEVVPEYVYEPDKERIVVQEHPCEEEAFEAEKFLISFFGRKDLGTGCLNNLTNGGEGVSGLKNPHTAEWNSRISESHKGKEVPQAMREQISRKLKGRKIPKDTLLKRAKAQTGLKRSVATRHKMSISAKNQKRTEAQKKALSEVVRLLWQDPEYRARMLEARKK
jgi:hypothetical protein